MSGITCRHISQGGRKFRSTKKHFISSSCTFNKSNKSYTAPSTNHIYRAPTFHNRFVFAYTFSLRSFLILKFSVKLNFDGSAVPMKLFSRVSQLGGWVGGRCQYFLWSQNMRNTTKGNSTSLKTMQPLLCFCFNQPTFSWLPQTDTQPGPRITFETKECHRHTVSAI